MAKIKVLLDRLRGVELPSSTERQFEADRVTVEVGGVKLDMTLDRALGRPVLYLRAVEGQIAFVPSTSNAVYIQTFDDFETSKMAQKDRRDGL